MIVVGGEALIDLVASGAGELQAHPGGGPFNAARTIARLEQPAAYLGRLSNDQFGRRLRAELEDSGVDMGTAVATDDPTTLALAEFDDGGSASYRFYTAGTSAPGLTVEDARRVLPERVTGLLVGTLGIVLEPMASTLEEVYASAAEDTIRVLDPNCRPLVISDPDGYRARLTRMLAHTDLVKASEEDLEWLHPGPTIDAARRLLADGAGTVIVTRGGEGATVVTAEHEFDVAAPQVTVVDTIGAGDAFAGGLLAFWHERGYDRDRLHDADALREATAFACLVAARNVERAGASPPRLSELRPSQ